MLGQFEPFTEERHEFCSGPEPQLTARVDFLDPAFELVLAWFCVWPELEDERASHH